LVDSINVVDGFLLFSSADRLEIFLS